MSKGKGGLGLLFSPISQEALSKTALVRYYVCFWVCTWLTRCLWCSLQSVSRSLSACCWAVVPNPVLWAAPLPSLNCNDGDSSGHAGSWTCVCALSDAALFFPLKSQCLKMEKNKLQTVLNCLGASALVKPAEQGRSKALFWGLDTWCHWHWQRCTSVTKALGFLHPEMCEIGTTDWCSILRSRAHAAVPRSLFSALLILSMRTAAVLCL